MKLTPEIIEIAEDMPNWDEDLRQDLYVKWLEADEEEFDLDTPAKIRAYLHQRYKNLKYNRDSVAARRAELEKENVEAITRNLGLADVAADPFDKLAAEEEVTLRLKEMSPLIRETFDRVILGGESIEAVALDERTTANVIYQRVWEAKKILQGDTQ